MLRRVALLTTVTALAAVGSTAQAATIWTPLSSGTAGTITSIVYQSPTRFWYATSGGTIAFFNGTGFSAGTVETPGEDFVDLAFQSGGPNGYAVTSNGHVWRSTDGGVSWKELTSPTTLKDCSNPSSPVIETELNAVQWAGSSTVFLMGDESTILRSTNADSGVPTFTEINKVGTGTCAVQSETFMENLTDATFLPANPADALFVDQNFGSIYESNHALTVSVTGALVTGETVNSFTGNPRIAQDPVSPNRIWVADHETGGAGCGTLCLVRSTDGGSTSSAATFPNDAHVIGGLYDISSQGGVEVTAGSGGEIFTSIDGANFYDQPAEGTLATENWRAEAAFDAQHAAVGGENGALAITSAANTIPTPPGTTPGPTTGSGTPPPTGGPAPGPPTGSKPTRLNIGGAVITVYRVVTVTGRNARFVPVVVSTAKPRRFLAQILRLKGKKALATGRLTIKGRHGGHGTIRLHLSAGVKPGTYLILVRASTLAGKAVGKPVKVRFTLK